MKRSEINGHIRAAEEFFAGHGFHLPAWAHLTPKAWRSVAFDCNEVFARGLGWDITDFNLGTFERRGLVLFTLRNGKLEPGHKPYAEKAMMVGVNQETPFHYHWVKIEDIINRAGGTLVLEVGWEDKSSGKLSNSPVSVLMDGVQRTFAPREQVRLSPGESITLPVELFHRFWAEGEPVLVGEVSMVNDDTGDNHFLDPLPRFPEITEDEPAERRLVTDYR